jgi:hypothetical protein
MSVKGTWPRKDQTTREEKDLRRLYMQGEISLAVFNKRYKILHEQGKITRSGKVLR